MMTNTLKILVLAILFSTATLANHGYTPAGLLTGIIATSPIWALAIAPSKLKPSSWYTYPSAVLPFVAMTLGNTVLCTAYEKYLGKLFGPAVATGFAMVPLLGSFM